MWLCVLRNGCMHRAKKMGNCFLFRVMGGENPSSIKTLDLYKFMMLFRVKTGFGLSTAKLLSPWILRHEGAIDRADKSLTLFADFRANSRAFLSGKTSVVFELKVQMFL